MDAERRLPASRDELLAMLAASRARLEATIDALDEERLVSPRDDGGWNIADHVVNIALWERSIVSLLRGMPRYEAIGVDEEAWLELDEHGLNALMVAEWRERPVREVLALFRDVHQQLLVMLERLSWDDLQRPYRDYLPDDAIEGRDAPVIRWLYGNTINHFDEHRVWIEALAAREPARP